MRDEVKEGRGTEQLGSPRAALLVDYGGVMTTSLTASFGAFCVQTGVSPERLKDVLSQAYSGPTPAGASLDRIDLIIAMETGRLSIDEFSDRLAGLLSEGLADPLDPTNLVARLFAGAGPDDRMIEAVRSAHDQGIKTAMVSNSWGVPEAPPWYEVFDAVVLSGEEGVRKPDPAIYLLAARRLGEVPEACVFVDDLPVNVDGARAVGMAGVLHRHPEVTIPRLEELLATGLG